MKTRPKDTILNVRSKETNKKYNSRSISFTFSVGPYVSFVERIIEYSSGKVGCNFVFIIHTKYDIKKHGCRCIHIDDDKKQDGACVIIKKHHTDMIDDPERLTTDFLLKLINIECEGENKP